MSSTGFLGQFPSALGGFPSSDPATLKRYRYGYIGLTDRRMVPILRPGSMVLVDTTRRQVDDVNWSSEYDRPIYFVELRDGYRCGWFQREKSRLIMQPHTLSRCAPETWRLPEEAELIGQVVGVATYLNDPWVYSPGASRPTRSDWKSTNP